MEAALAPRAQHRRQDSVDRIAIIACITTVTHSAMVTRQEGDA
jgi:hypothetical protein